MLTVKHMYICDYINHNREDFNNNGSHTVHTGVAVCVGKGGRAGCGGRNGSVVTSPAAATGELDSPGTAFCDDSQFGSRSNPVFLQQHVKDLGHSGKSAVGRLQLKTHTPYLCGFE